MLIKIDTDNITSAANAINQASQAVEEASQILRSIPEHNDWTCKEKDTIDEYLTEDSQIVNRIDERTLNFARVMKSVTDSFMDREKSISGLFEGLEAVLGPSIGKGVIEATGNYRPGDEWRNAHKEITQRSHLDENMVKAQDLLKQMMPSQVVDLKDIDI